MNTETAMIEIDKLVEWSPPVRVQTKFGPKMLSKAKPTDAFYRAWKAGKDALKAAGVSMGKDVNTGDWEALWWRDVSKEEVEARKRNLVASEAIETDIQIPTPEGLKFYPFQQAGVAFARGKEGTLFGDDMGLGKTCQAIGLINLDPEIRNALIVCPATIKINWHRELRRWLTRAFTIGIAEGDSAPMTDIVIINFDIIGRHQRLLDKEWDYACVDEAHFCKDPKARRTRLICAIKAKRRVALTGTPIVNKVEEMWPILNWLAPRIFPSFYRFKYKYGQQGENEAEELQRELRSTVMVRRIKQDVLKDLPAKQRQVIEFPATGLAAEAVANEKKAMADVSSYVSMVEELEAAVMLAKVSEDPEDYKLAVAKLKSFSESVAFEDIARLRHQTSVAKVPVTLAHIRTCMESVPKLVVFGHHRDCLEPIVESVPNSVLLYGGMDTTKKQAVIDRFVNDPDCRLFGGSMRAAGFGVDGLQKVCSHVLFHELDWTPAVMTQCEDRCHRIGTTDPVLIQTIVLEDSLDVQMAHTLIRKQEICDRALDSDRLLEEQEPVILKPAGPKSVMISVAEIKKQSLDFDPQRAMVVHKLLQMLAGVCDGAMRRDDTGFNGFDARIGHSLANQRSLTARQAVLGAKIIRKYHKQLPPDLLAVAIGDQKEKETV